MKEEYSFEEIKNGEFELYIDSVYKGGSLGHAGDDPLPKIINVGVSGGFRTPKKQNGDDRDYPAYVVLYTSGEEIEWPDQLDVESGIFMYFGDNRRPGRGLHETPKGGNVILRDTFHKLHGGKLDRKKIPPFFVFQKTGDGRSVRFLGLAAPGVKNRSSDEDLIAIWRSAEGKRFQNYRAFFTILDTGEDPIDKRWINALIENDEPQRYEPKVWTEFVENGIHGLKPLIAPKITKLRSKKEQLPTENDLTLLEVVYDFFSQDRDHQTKFEEFAAQIIEMSDRRYISFDLTRPWRDGGRDALGYYRIGTRLDSILVECALEAKCYNLNNGVGVKDTSRLISRIRYRQFGILVTTSYLSKQAYKEIIEDNHPIIVFSGKDIVQQLKWNELNTEGKIRNWIEKMF